MGRWFVVDPLAEKVRRHSVYNYAFDNLNQALSSEYDEGVRIETTEQEDKIALETAVEDAESHYSVLGNNCIDTCTKAVESVGKKGGSTIQERTGLKKRGSNLPNGRYDQIVNDYPDAEIIKINNSENE